MQGKIYDVKILRGDAIIEYPEYDGTSNSLRLFRAPSEVLAYGPTACGFLAASAISTTAEYRWLSGQWSYTASDNRFTRVSGTGSLMYDYYDRNCTILTENGLYGNVRDVSSNTLAVDCIFYSMSGGSKIPQQHRSDFTAISAKITIQERIAEVTTYGGTTSFTVQSILSAGVIILNRQFTTGPCIRDMSLGAVMFGAVGSPSIMRWLISQVNLPAPINVFAGDQISISYSLSGTYQSISAYGSILPMSQLVDGWPMRYPATNIVGNGTHVTVTVPAIPKQHYRVGDTITVEAVPLRHAVISVNSTGVTWTINATAHGYVASDSVVHENISKAGYNGTYTVASVPDVNTYTVTNGTNPGASSGGTTRKNTPGSYYGGEHIVTSLTPTTVTYANITTGTTPVDTSSVVLTSPDRMRYYYLMPESSYTSTIYNHGYMIRDTQMSAYPVPATPHSGGNWRYYGSTSMIHQNVPYGPGAKFVIGINDKPLGSPNTVDDWDRISRIVSVNSNSNSEWFKTERKATIILELETPQPKHQGYALTLNCPALPAEGYTGTPSWADAPTVSV